MGHTQTKMEASMKTYDINNLIADFEGGNLNHEEVCASYINSELWDCIGSQKPTSWKVS